jgi:hypothetical protein
VRNVQLSNTANWQLLETKTVETAKAQLQDGTYIHTPFSDIDIPFLLDNFIIAIKVYTSIPPKSSWKFAGYAKQKISTGLAFGVGQDAVKVNYQPLFLNQINLLLFEKLSNSYSIALKPPKWFTDITYTIWQYTGVDTDSVQSTIDLSGIENTVVNVGRQVVRNAQVLESIERRLDNLDSNSNFGSGSDPFNFF